MPQYLGKYNRVAEWGSLGALRDLSNLGTKSTFTSWYNAFERCPSSREACRRARNQAAGCFSLRWLRCLMAYHEVITRETLRSVGCVSGRTLVPRSNCLVPVHRCDVTQTMISTTRFVSHAAGLFSYARDGADVELRGVSLFDNTVARGSVVFVVNSVLKTYQVRTQ